MKRVERFVTRAAEIPFDLWLLELDTVAQAKIGAFINRVASGGSGKNVKPVGSGFFEIKIDSGPGYREYFGEVRNVLILLLIGGDKKTQERDIRKAQLYWEEYEKN
jgi:putative addiction module killer protein